MSPIFSLPQTQRVGILINAVDVDYIFKVKMRTRRIARTADLRDNLPCADDLPRRHVQSTAMSVARVGINRGVINQNLVAVAVSEIRGNDNLSVKK